MMLQLLLFIKHRLTFLWTLAEAFNGLLFRLFFASGIAADTVSVCQRYSGGTFRFKPATSEDLPNLAAFFQAQPEESYRYFRPHGFDIGSLQKLYRNPAFIQLLAFSPEGRIAGYFMIRFFVNRQAYVGFLVGEKYQGRGLAKIMCRIIFDICWPNRFRTFATVSEKNARALAAYRGINNYKTLKHLPDDYIQIEYTPEGLVIREREGE